MPQTHTARTPEGDVEVPYSAAGRLGLFIYRRRALFLLPELLVPVLLLNHPGLLPLPWRLASYGLAAAGALLRVYCTGFRTWAHKAGGSRHLMTAGPYGRLRHPLYLANFLLFLPLFLVVNLWPLTLGFAAWYFLTHYLVMVREDQVLRARYGGEWEDYAASVRRFLPRLRAYRPSRGSFHLAPVLKGREPLQLGLWFALFALFEVFRPEVTGLIDRLHRAAGLSLWS